MTKNLTLKEFSTSEIVSTCPVCGKDSPVHDYPFAVFIETDDTHPVCGECLERQAPRAYDELMDWRVEHSYKVMMAQRSSFDKFTDRLSKLKHDLELRLFGFTSF